MQKLHFPSLAQTPPNNPSQAPELVPITNLPDLRAAGICWPATVPSWRWQYLRRHENGLAEAFARVGTRILVVVPKFKQLVAARNGQGRRA
jgi:hypothetical protein